MNNKLPIRFAEREKNVKNAFLDAYFDPETGDFCEGRAAGNAYGLALGLGDERTKKHLVEKYEALGRLIPEFSARRCFWNNCFPSAQGIWQ